jgi:hypothetical protein
LALLGWGALAEGGTETFSATPLSSKWDLATNRWVGDSGAEIEAWNARSNTVWVDNPAIAIRSNGWISVALTNRSLQHLRVDFRQILSAQSDCRILVNGKDVGGYKPTTNAVDHMEWEVLDPDTQHPFWAGDEGLTVTISNRIKTAGPVAIDNLEWADWELWVNLDKSGTNAVHAADDEFGGGEFDIEAHVSDFEGDLDESNVDGFWSVSPAFQGGTTGMDGRHLTLTATLEDVGNVYELTYTAIRALSGEINSNGTEKGISSPRSETRWVTNSATAWVEVLPPKMYRWIDFENDPKFTKATNGVPQSVLLSGGPWYVHGAHRAGDKDDPKIGNYAIGMLHTSNTRPAWMESGFPFYNGIGTLSFRYANYSASNPKIALLIQTKSQEDEEWTTVEGGDFTAEAHYDISNEEFRVDIQEEGERMLRIMTAPNVAGNAGMRVNLDDIHVRPFGETAPVLVWAGQPYVPAGDAWESWQGCFVYTNAESSDYQWIWEAEEPLSHSLLCTTNGNTLSFSLREPVSGWFTNRLTAQVLCDGKVDQKKSVDLMVASPPEFELSTATNVIRLAEANVLDVHVTNVRLYGSGTNWSVQWTATPPFSGTNTIKNKSRYIVREMDQTENSEHWLTALLKETTTQLTTEKTLYFRVIAKEQPVPVPVLPEILGILDGALSVGNIQAGHSYRVFSVESLENGEWKGEGEPRQAGTNDSLVLPVPILSNNPSVYFFGVVDESQ